MSPVTVAAGDGRRCRIEATDHQSQYLQTFAAPRGNPRHAPREVSYM